MSMSDWSDDYQYDGDEMDMSQEHDFNEEDDVSMGFHEAQDDNITPRNFCLLPISDINPSVCLFIHLMCFIRIHTWFLWCLLQNIPIWFIPKNMNLNEFRFVDDEGYFRAFRFMVYFSKVTMVTLRLLLWLL